MSTYNVGVVIGALLIPIIGVTLLIIGLVQRFRPRQPPPVPPYGYPGAPYPPPPQGYGPAGAPPVNSPYPPPAGAPYYPPPGQWPPPPRPKPRGTALIVTGTVLLVLGLLGGVVRAAQPSDSAGSGGRDSGVALNVGDCVDENDFGDRDAAAASCTSPAAVMELVSRGGADADCPDGKGHADTDYTTLFWDDITLCFAANFIEGNCYAVNTTGTSGPPFTLEDCGGSRAEVEVVQRVDGSTDSGQCPAGTRPISYMEPARLFCLQPAG